MILEVAQITIKPGMESEPLFKAAKGCKAMELRRSIESPARYLLFVTWETLENHTVDFRGSANFTEWRNLVSHCFDGPPHVEHVQSTLTGF